MGRSSGRDRKKRGPVSQQVWHDKDPSLLKGRGRRTEILQSFGNGDVSIFKQNVNQNQSIDQSSEKATASYMYNQVTSRGKQSETRTFRFLHVSFPHGKPFSESLSSWNHDVVTKLKWHPLLWTKTLNSFFYSLKSNTSLSWFTKKFYVFFFKTRFKFSNASSLKWVVVLMK